MSADAPRLENPELLAAVIANPDEDTPRLMYADWLQENGDEARAEFIRLHIEWDRRPAYAPPNDDLKRRLIDVWKTVELREGWDSWPQWIHYAFERGFRSTASFETDDADIHETAERMFRSAPIRVLFTHPSGYHRSNEDTPSDHFLEVMRSVPPVTAFGTVLTPDGGLESHWEEYLNLPESSALRVLDINYSNGQRSCPLVARLTNLTNLLVLDLTVCCRLGDWGLEQLVGAAHLKSLVALRLAANDEYRGSITEDGIRVLVESPHLTNLRQLTLNNHEDLNDAAVRRLLGWNRVGHLEVLEISCRDITDAGVVALARSRKLRNLRRLVLDGRGLESSTVATVLDSPNLRGLTELYFSPPPASLTAELLHRLRQRFPDYANMRFDPAPVCVEDRIRARYQLMIHPNGDGTYRGRDQAGISFDGGHRQTPLHPEYAIL